MKKTVCICYNVLAVSCLHVPVVHLLYSAYTALAVEFSTPFFMHGILALLILGHGRHAKYMHLHVSACTGK